MESDIVWEKRAVLRQWRESKDSEVIYTTHLVGTDTRGRRYVQLREPVESLHEIITERHGPVTWVFPEEGDIVMLTYFTGKQSHPGTKESKGDAIRLMLVQGRVCTLMPLQTITSQEEGSPDDTGFLVARYSDV